MLNVLDKKYQVFAQSLKYYLGNSFFLGQNIASFFLQVSPASILANAHMSCTSYDCTCPHARRSDVVQAARPRRRRKQAPEAMYSTTTDKSEHFWRTISTRIIIPRIKVRIPWSLPGDVLSFFSFRVRHRKTKMGRRKVLRFWWYCTPCAAARMVRSRDCHQPTGIAWLSSLWRVSSLFNCLWLCAGTERLLQVRT